MTDVSKAVAAGVVVIVASVGMIWWGSRLDEVSRPSKRVAVLGVSVLALLIGAILTVRVTARPAYEATAEIAVDSHHPISTLTDEGGRAEPDLEVERLILASPRVADDAVALAADLDSGEFPWYGPGLLDFPLPFDQSTILNNYQTEIDTDSHRILVHFRADNPTVARLAANLIVEAYRQWRPKIHSRPSLDPAWSATLDPLEPVTVSVSFAATPTNRIDRPDGADVLWFLLVSLLAVSLTWRWWPAAVRETAA